MRRNIILILAVIGIILVFIGVYFRIDNFNKANNSESDYEINENNFNFENAESDIELDDVDMEDTNYESDIELDDVNVEGTNYESNIEESKENKSKDDSSDYDENKLENNNSNTINKGDSTSNNNDNLNNESETNGTQSKMELKQLGNLQYYLYIPSNPISNMPLIMYLHGGTNKKSDVTSLITVDGFPKYLSDGYYGNLRAYVVIPKLDNNYKGWDDISDTLRDLIKTMNNNYQIDMKKVSLTGHSMGGTGTYQVQIKLSNTFACIAPMSGSIKNTQTNIEALGKTKIWAFVGTEDTIVNPESTNTIIKELQESGKDAKITKLEGAGHFDVPSLAYKNDDLIKWLVNCGE